MFIYVSYKGEVHPFQVEPHDRVSVLTAAIEKQWDIAPENQRLIFKSAFKGNVTQFDKTLEECGFQDGNRVMLMGTKKEDIVKVQESKPSSLPDDPVMEERWEEEEKHARIISMGLFANAPFGNKGNWELPEDKQLTHLRNQFGNKCRMIFKYDHIKFFTNAGDTELPYDEIKDISCQDISKFPGYSIVRFETIGNSCSKLFHIYFVPTQYTAAIATYNMGNKLPEGLSSLFETFF